MDLCSPAAAPGASTVLSAVVAAVAAATAATGAQDLQQEQGAAGARPPPTPHRGTPFDDPNNPFVRQVDILLTYPNA